MSTGNKNHAAVALLQELQRTNAGKKFNITTANPLLAGTYSSERICATKLYIVYFNINILNQPIKVNYFK